MTTNEPELSPTVANAKGLRKGWTTGTCASAAAKAATIGLLTGEVPTSIDVTLPSGDQTSFATSDVAEGQPNRAAIIKDAGDDPDCTNGGHITAVVEWACDAADLDESDWNEPGFVAASAGPAPIELRGGDGVGTVTKPGLGLQVGGPAINSVPSRMIRQAITQVLQKHSIVAAERPLVCTVSVPGGQAMSLKTSNDRLGIMGGISILGTTGIVKPFSTASWRASVAQQVDVAAAQGADLVVVCTGSRSDTWAQADMPELDPVSFIEVGDFTGIALRRASGAGLDRLRFVGMAGKIAKLADGIMMTHFHRSKVNTEFLADIARSAGAPDAVIAGATRTTTARHFCELCIEHGVMAPLVELCRLAARNCESHAGGTLSVEVVMVDFEGKKELCRG